MAQIVNVNFKMDAEDKRRMESACAGMGLSMSAAFTIFAKKVGRERRIPFEISAPDPFYDENNIRYLENIICINRLSGKQLHRILFPDRFIY